MKTNRHWTESLYVFLYPFAFVTIIASAIMEVYPGLWIGLALMVVAVLPWAIHRTNTGQMFGPL